ncbi:MAG: DUF308 domain-containing protein [Actinomycetota bacterium]|nr:DUF308 domain-containing protein [Actinomycetota bacterium]
MTTEAAPERTINYAFLLGGLTAAIFGIILLIFDEQALSLAVVLLGLWWLIQGAFMLFSVFIDKEDMGWKLFIGVLGLAAGVIVLANPGNAVDFLGGAFAIFLGIIGVLIGVAAIFGSFRGAGFGALLFGAVSAAIGLLFIFNSSFSFTALVTIFAILLLVDGVSAIYLAVKYK